MILFDTENPPHERSVTELEEANQAAQDTIRDLEHQLHKIRDDTAVREAAWEAQLRDAQRSLEDCEAELLHTRQNARPKTPTQRPKTPTGRASSEAGPNIAMLGQTLDEKLVLKDDALSLEMWYEKLRKLYARDPSFQAVEDSMKMMRTKGWDGSVLRQQIEDFVSLQQRRGFSPFIMDGGQASPRPTTILHQAGGLGGRGIRSAVAASWSGGAAESSRPAAAVRRRPASAGAARPQTPTGRGPHLADVQVTDDTGRKGMLLLGQAYAMPTDQSNKTAAGSQKTERPASAQISRPSGYDTGLAGRHDDHFGLLPLSASTDKIQSHSRRPEALFSPDDDAEGHESSRFYHGSSDRPGSASRTRARSDALINHERSTVDVNITLHHGLKHLDLSIYEKGCIPMCRFYEAVVIPKVLREAEETWRQQTDQMLLQAYEANRKQAEMAQLQTVEDALVRETTRIYSEFGEETSKLK